MVKMASGIAYVRVRDNVAQHVGRTPANRTWGRP